VALPAPSGLALGLLETLAGLSGHRPLDRLIRGRAWIGLVGFALIGIVAMQLWVVKLGVGIGRALEHAALLQRENSTLAIEDSALASGERVERLVAARGMVAAPPGALHFDPLRGALDARLAVAALARPTQPLNGGGTAASTATSSGEATGQAASGEASAASGEASAASPSTAGAPSSEATAATGSSETQSAASATAASGPAAEGSTGASTPTAEGAAGAPSSSSATAPATTGGSSEATGTSPASAPTGSGGGTQPSVGG
jgi:hypothetical protein